MLDDTTAHATDTTGVQAGGPPLPVGERVYLPGRGTTFVRRVKGPPGAPTLLLLHGWMASGGLNWFRVFDALGEHFDVIAVDMRGHGRGIRNGRRFRLADCADDAAATLDALGVGPVIAVGYSLGGPVAQLRWRRRTWPCRSPAPPSTPSRTVTSFARSRRSHHRCCAHASTWPAASNLGSARAARRHHGRRARQHRADPVLRDGAVRHGVRRRAGRQARGRPGGQPESPGTGGARPGSASCRPRPQTPPPPGPRPPPAPPPPPPARPPFP